jgi:Bacterial membrane protein YfhO
MLAGLPYFATNVHAYRTTGDIAWWNPVSQHGLGYAQYYQSFLSPVAPTSSHVLFVLWMQGIKVLSWAGITIPEYYQYLIFTYILSPFTAFFFFNLFLCRLFRSRWAILLAATAFAFSTVGLWFSAFLYFQETGTLFFLLAAWLGVVQRPTFSRAMLLLAAFVVQISSINYWTIYNSWFLLLMVGGHGWIHRNRLERAWRRAVQGIRQRRQLAIGLGAALVVLAGIWLYITHSIVHEQLELNLRPRRTYSIEEVHTRLEETRWFTVEPFNPCLERALHSYEVLNPIHNARYIGVTFLPLLALAPFYHWRRKERWLITVAVGVFCICMASPWFLQLWKWTPGMDRVWHFFYLYTHHLLLVLILLGAAAFEKLLNHLPALSRQKLGYVVLALLGISLLVLLGAGLVGDRFEAHSPAYEGVTRFGALFLISTLLLAQMVRRPQWRSQLAGLLLLVTFSDLTRYYLEANQADHEFTQQWRKKIPYPLPEENQALLSQPWPKVDPERGFTGGVDRFLPLETEIWPTNRFLTPLYEAQVSALADGDEAFDVPMSEVRFVPDAGTHEFAQELTGQNLFDQLLIHDRKTGTVQTPDGAKLANVPFHFTRWRYNDFSIDVDCPTGGWVFLRLLYDPRWKVKVDGKPVNPSRANMMCMTIPASAGKHRVDLEYRPRARRWFWPACWLTETTLAGLMILAMKNLTPRPPSLEGKGEQTFPPSLLGKGLGG